MGQEFVSEPGWDPGGFYAWAFANLERIITFICAWEDNSWAKEKGTLFSWYSDGFRPLIYELERVKE